MSLLLLPVGPEDHVRGPAAGAPGVVTLVHYGDFECPFSRRMHEVLREVTEAFPTRVRLAFRHFPLRMHPHALHAAEAAEAVAAQGAFWTYHDLLYARQLRLADADLVAHAESLRLDGKAVRAALAAGTYRARVLAAKRAAVTAGVESTMNLVVDGVLFQEDAVEDALVERVIRPLRTADA